MPDEVETLGEFICRRGLLEALTAILRNICAGFDSIQKISLTLEKRYAEEEAQHVVIDVYVDGSADAAAKADHWVDNENWLNVHSAELRHFDFVSHPSGR